MRATLFTGPKHRGIAYARIIKHRGYQVKIWQSFRGHWCWQAVAWPFLEQGVKKSEYGAQEDARETTDLWLANGFLLQRDDTLSASEMKQKKTYEDFCSWVARNLNLGDPPRIQELKLDLDLLEKRVILRLYHEARAELSNRQNKINP